MSATTTNVITGEIGARPKGKPWPLAEFSQHFAFTTKHARYLLDSGRVEFIRVGKRRRMIADHVVRKLEREGI